MKGESLLANWISPVSLSTFYNEYWDKKVLHISHASSYYHEVLNFEQVQDWFQNSGASCPRIRILRSKKSLNSDYPDQLLNKKIAIDEFNKGHPIVIDHFSTFAPTLYQHIKELNLYFKGKTKDYLIVSPPKKPSFESHLDKEHVIVLQIHGTKDWHFTERPSTSIRESIKYNIDCKIPNSIRVREGDFLYLPPGIFHSTETTGDKNSISLSITIDLINGIDILDALKSQAQFFFPDIGKMIPHPNAPSEQKTKYISELKAGLIEYIESSSFEDIIEEIADKRREEYLQQPSLQSCLAHSPVTPDTKLEIGNRKKTTYSKHENIIRLKSKSNIYTIHAIHEAGIKHMLSEQYFTARSLPLLLSVEIKLEFVTELLDDGVLIVSEQNSDTES